MGTDPALMISVARNAFRFAVTLTFALICLPSNYAQTVNLSGRYQCAEAKVGGWGQGIAWSKDGKTLLFQAMLNKELQVLSFDGKDLKVTSSIKVNGGPAGLRTVER